ncbi:MAG: acyl carrier protein [Firmicutes bacterium]|nr:acyl carrier protein [Bacillota bacterium]
MASNIDKFKKVLSNSLGIKNFEELTDDMGPDEIEDWDSLAQVEMVSGFEDEFCINLDVIDVSRMYNIGSIKDILKKYGVAV